MKQLKSNNRLLGVLPGDDILSQCIHCGMCLSSCPTYELTKQERSSPRGRIRMIKSVARGELEMSPLFAEEMGFCLDCQACETACPAGVKYGSMVEAARVEVENAGINGVVSKLIKTFVLKFLIAKNRNLKIAARLLYYYQVWGIQKALHKSGIFKFLFFKISELDKLAPKVSKSFSSAFLPEVYKAQNAPKYRIAFLTGCLMDVMFAEINKDTVDVLSHCGCEVYIPKGQVCCGSLHAHNGDLETAKALAKKNIDEFEKANYDYLVSNSAGCGAFMKEYYHVLNNDPIYAERAKIFSNKVFDVSEFLWQIKDEIRFKPLETSVTYHDACHLAHTQKITSQPREVLRMIPGLNLVPLTESSWCCGSAGIYNITNYEDSMKILERKMLNIKRTGASIVLTGNPGCIQQIKYGAEKFNMKIEVLHPVTLIKSQIIT